MSEIGNVVIEIPCDSEGFVLLQCPCCGELFKLKPSDYESDDVLDISCPSCGIISDAYLTEEVVELAVAIMKNRLLSSLHNDVKRLERQTRGKPVFVKAGKAPRYESESPLKPSVDALAVAKCSHCGKESKVSMLLKMSSYVCPLCGVSVFNAR